MFEGLKGEESISELCRREGISQNLTSWSPPSREYNERPTRDEVVGVEMLDRDDPFLASIPGPDRWGCRPAHPPILPAASEATAEPEWLDA